ncbi:MAG: hypothetical protein WC310_01040 [Patescibacteria group bacterium]|jgi:regulator of replication initiation timing
MSNSAVRNLAATPPDISASDVVPDSFEKLQTESIAHLANLDENELNGVDLTEEEKNILKEGSVDCPVCKKGKIHGRYLFCKILTLLGFLLTTGVFSHFELQQIMSSSDQFIATVFFGLLGGLAGLLLGLGLDEHIISNKTRLAHRILKREKIQKVFGSEKPIAVYVKKKIDELKNHYLGANSTYKKLADETDRLDLEIEKLLTRLKSFEIKKFNRQENSLCGSRIAELQKIKRENDESIELLSRWKQIVEGRINEIEARASQYYEKISEFEALRLADMTISKERKTSAQVFAFIIEETRNFHTSIMNFEQDLRMLTAEAEVKKALEKMSLTEENLGKNVDIINQTVTGITSRLVS